MIRRLIILLLIVGCEEPSQHGCLDSQACNYDSKATIDNNSCEYVIDCEGVCGGELVEDCEGVCGGNSIVDNCGTCDADTTNDCVQDCAGEWGKNVELWGECYNIGNTTYLDLMPYDDGHGATGQLTGIIPPEIGDLVNITRLQLENNYLTGEIPSEIGNLTNLTSLNLANNQFTGEIPPEIGNLINLEHLTLSQNQLTGSIPVEIGNLTTLRRLTFMNNQFSGTFPEIICEIILDFGDDPYSWNFNINNNQICPPYPSCFQDDDLEQDTSNCNN